MLTETAAVRLSKNPIAKILTDVYGVTALAADPITIEWAADRMVETNGAALTAVALRTLNSARERMGKMPVYPRYGTPLFGL